MCYERRDPAQARACFERDQRKDDYISRKALLEAYDKAHVGPPGGARKLIEEAPAADVAPVVHGRWELECETYGKMRCSVCKKETLLEKATGDVGVITLYVDSHYCPNCGADMRMDGKE